MRQVHSLTARTRRLVLAAMLVPAAFALAFMLLELGSAA